MLSRGIYLYAPGTILTDLLQGLEGLQKGNGGIIPAVSSPSSSQHLLRSPLA